MIMLENPWHVSFLRSVILATSSREGCRSFDMYCNNLVSFVMSGLSSNYLSLDELSWPPSVAPWSCVMLRWMDSGMGGSVSSFLSSVLSAILSSVSFIGFLSTCVSPFSCAISSSVSSYVFLAAICMWRYKTSLMASSECGHPAHFQLETPANKQVSTVAQDKAWSLSHPVGPEGRSEVFPQNLPMYLGSCVWRQYAVGVFLYLRMVRNYITLPCVHSKPFGVIAVIGILNSFFSFSLPYLGRSALHNNWPQQRWRDGISWSSGGCSGSVLLVTLGSCLEEWSGVLFSVAFGPAGYAIVLPDRRFDSFLKAGVGIAGPILASIRYGNFQLYLLCPTALRCPGLRKLQFYVVLLLLFHSDGSPLPSVPLSCQ